ncbi:MAG: redoxin domain-containing protein [Gammaproteobacteria bacterium]|nr:redoxin domain-containing protein [Gammaproteobacteria bacterium]
MKHLEPSLSVSLCVVLLVSFLVSACSVDPSKQYTISVEYQPIELNEQNFEDETDYSSATVSIKRIDVNESNEESLTELISSPFRNGKVELRGPLEQPMWVEVLVETDTAATPLNLRTFVEPSENISLAVVDFKIPYQDDLVAHIGTVSNVQDPNKKFSLIADFNASSFDTPNVIAKIVVSSWNERGLKEWNTVSSVVVREGRFTVEMEVEEPIVLTAEIADLRSFYLTTRLIAEPGTTIRLEPSRRTAITTEYLTTGWFQERENTSQRSQSQALVAAADTDGRHKRLVESWRESFTYRLKQKQLEDAREEESIRFDELATMRPILQEASDSQSEDDVSGHAGSSWVKTDPAEGCEHVDLSQVRPDMWNNPSDPNPSTASVLQDEIFNIEFMALGDIARRARDPIDSLLALEFGAWFSLADRSEAINILDGLAPNVSPTIAEQRIAPMRRILSAIMQSEKNAPFRVPGQKAPDFELFNLQGMSQTFSQILKDNDLVFLEFVRSAEYYADVSQNLSLLYNEFKEEGLQIVTVLFGVDDDQQQELVANQNDEWVLLLDPRNTLDSDLAKSYAIVHRPMDYVVDAYGCIIQRSLSLTNLRDFLNSYFGIPASTDPSEDVISP